MTIDRRTVAAFVVTVASLSGLAACNGSGASTASSTPRSTTESTSPSTGLSTGPTNPAPTTPDTIAETACSQDGPTAEVRTALLAGEVGVGVADYPGYPVADVPKATAAFLMAEVMCAKSAPSYDRTVMDALGASLLDWPTEFPSAQFGWGLPFAWDAFGDGTTNPPHTVYSISTGVAVKALLDWAEISDTETQRRVHLAVDEALAQWEGTSETSESGQMPYSLSEYDRPYEVFNSSAMLAGQMQRFAALGVSERSDAFAAEADRVVRSLVDQHQVDTRGNWYWNYSTAEPVANDLTHAGYIVDGVVAYVAHGGALAPELPVDSVVGHILMFRSDGTIGEAMLPWPIWRSVELTSPQARALRLYEVGWALFTVSHHRDLLGTLADPVCEIGRRHRDEAGMFRKYPVDIALDESNPVVYEYLAYYYLGLVSLGWDACAA